MLRKFRWIAAAVIAYLLAFPMAEKAVASSAGDIVSASLSLAGAIISAASHS